ncbi:hypothetical protein DSM43518_00220 [Mycobacterium marinum]|nr:hypothetical protein DSM43518_00220 [Mycobacterium marinum]RFZ47114.1 hypothetical protein MSS2_05309 [Mycobacterium marinum]RFZ49629.1 hypothetical protein MSS4_02601 [Mycobacterium marinum]
MFDAWALMVAVLAFVVSGSALVIAWWQLVLQRDAAGGRGVIFDVNAPMRTIHRRRDGTERVTNGYRVYVRLVGNDRYEVTVHLERDGRPIEPSDLGIKDKPPPVLHRWTSEDDPIRWNFDLDPAVAEDLWCVLSWVSPFGEGIRTDAYRRRLGHNPQFEQWHWFRFFGPRRRIETWASRNGPTWFRRWVGKARPLGEWRPHRMRALQPGQSPLSSAPPDE